MKPSSILAVFIGLLFAFIVYKLLYPTKVVASKSSSANTDETPTIVNPPTISSNPTNVVAGTSVTYTAINVTGVNQWFKNGTYFSDGATLTVANPTATDIYTAKCFFNNIFSVASNSITVQSAPVVVVTVPAPTIVSNPTNVIAGTSVTFTATIAAGINQWLKNGVYLQDGLTLTVANPSANDVYSSKCLSGATYSNTSNLITVTVATSYVSSFINYLKQIPFETQIGKYSPHLFPKVNIEYSLDTAINKPYPTIAIGWQADNFSFLNNNRNHFDSGIAFNVDIVGSDGFGVRGTDYILPDSAGEVDSQFPAVNYQNFVSALPFEKRARYVANSGQTGDWTGLTLEQCYLQGKSHTQDGTAIYGRGDLQNGKSNIGLTMADQEGVNAALSPEHHAYQIGMASGNVGYNVSMYSTHIDSGASVQPNVYPLDPNNPNSVYGNRKQYHDGTDFGAAFGGAPDNYVWSENSKLNLPNLGINNKSLLDFPNVGFCTEISFSDIDCKRHGETYTNPQNQVQTVVNKFGAYPTNADHVVARTLNACDSLKWFAVNRMNNRKGWLQSKLVSDRGNAIAFEHVNRRTALAIAGFTLVTGLEWYNWDKAYNLSNCDGYNGALQIINQLYQKIDFGGSVFKSFAQLKPTCKFLLHQSEISYDNGVNYVQDKAPDYIMNPSKLPQRQFITPDGYWGGLLCRTENTEVTTCKLRVKHNNVFRYYDVRPEMWETTNYALRNTALNQIPNTDKDYHFFIVKIS